MRGGFGRRAGLLLLGSVLALAVIGSASAATGSRTWVNDFERPSDITSAGDWFDGTGVLKRVPSGYTSTAGYGSGIASAHGRWHARIDTSACGPRPAQCDGPFTHWGKNHSTNTVWPSRGYVTELDIYLDVAWAASHPDYRFDWISSINDNTGNFRRDWVFNAGTQPLTDATPGFYVNASTNSTRSGAFPENPCPNPAAPPNACRTPVKITDSGWYTFRHRFYSQNYLGVDYLAVDFMILRNNVVVASWTIVSAPDDPIAMIGGDRYGWFSNQEIKDLAIDCSTIHPPAFGHPALYTPCNIGHRDEGDGEHGEGREHHPRDDDNQSNDDEQDRRGGQQASSAGQVQCSNSTITANSMGGTQVADGADVVVPAGSTCAIDQSHVGSVSCHGCASVDLTNSTADGGVEVVDSLLGSYLIDNQIGGDLVFTGNAGILDLEGNNVSGDANVAGNLLADGPMIVDNLFRDALKVAGNTAIAYEVTGNRVRQGFDFSSNTGLPALIANAVGEALTCDGNLGLLTGTGNTAGQKLGQCALL